VGVAVAGLVDPKTGGIVMAPNISNRSDPSLRSRAGFDLRSILADALGLDVLMENDVNLAAVGEHWRGALVQALVKLYQDNASTLTPDPMHSAFYDSHPPASIRIELIEPWPISMLL
jgi:hypothetical protein